LVVCHYRSEGMLAIVGGIGCMIIWQEPRWKLNAKDLADIFYGPLWGEHHVHLGQLSLTLGIVMLGLLAIGLSPDLDELL
jgi:hypothetical protein